MIHSEVEKKANMVRERKLKEDQSHNGKSLLFFFFFLIASFLRISKTDNNLLTYNPDSGIVGHCCLFFCWFCPVCLCLSCLVGLGVGGWLFGMGVGMGVNNYFLCTPSLGGLFCVFFTCLDFIAYIRHLPCFFNVIGDSVDLGKYAADKRTRAYQISRFEDLYGNTMLATWDGTKRE